MSAAAGAWKPKRPDLSSGALAAARLVAQGSTRWWIAIAALVRRGMIDKGLEPAEVERRFDDKLGEIVGLASSRLLGETVPMRLLEPDEVRRIAFYIATRIKADDVAHEDYPAGWRDELRFVKGDPEPKGREPGEDDE